MKKKIFNYSKQPFARHFMLFILSCILLLTSSCKKNWLDEKPDSHLAVLSSLTDYQTLLDNRSLSVSNYIGEAATDNCYVAEINFPWLNVSEIAVYIWAPNGYGVPTIDVWGLYNGIFNCNTALAGLGKIDQNSGNKDLYNQVYGSALFWRAFTYYELGQAFMKSYDSTSANTDPGIPLRLDADINAKVGRGTVKQVYDQIFSDLLQASTLLPPSTQVYKTRPNKGSAYAMLARAYLAVEDYKKALSYADSSLKLNGTLLDYNTVTPSRNFGMPAFNKNPEVIFYSWTSSGHLNMYNAEIDSSLYQMYSTNDLRKTYFFTSSSSYTGVNGISFIGTYDGTNQNAFFTAPAVDELYLIRSECYARTGNISAAMNDLNTLLITRWKNGTFVPYTAADMNDALTKILTERRKELIMRATRWTDLRRLNKDPRFATTLTKIYNGTVYTLPPNDNKYVYPIPDDEILYSGIAQNPR